MTSPRRFEQDLPALLADLYIGVTPDYRDDLIGQTARSSQRPAWTFLERWIPVDIATRRLPTANVPWRLIGVALLLLALLGAVLFVVGAPHRVPPPFGPAANGSLLAAKGGDIIAVDPATGASRTLVGGADVDDSAGASPDGVLLAFIRTADGQRYLSVADIDGTHVHRVLADPLFDDWDLWAPDSRHLGVITRVDGRRAFMLVPTDGGRPAVADLGDIDPIDFEFRPPDGHEVVIRGVKDGLTRAWLMNVDGTNRRQLDLVGSGAIPGGFELSGTSWNPSGSELAYNVVHDPSTGADVFRVHVFTVATGIDRQLATPPQPAVNEAWPRWSPQGTEILVQRFRDGDGWIETVPADGSAAIRSMGPHAGSGPDAGAEGSWSPDGRIILLTVDGQRLYSIDAATGQPTLVTSWPVNRIDDWQRLALP